MAFIIYLGTMIKLVYRVGLVAAFAALLAACSGSPLEIKPSERPLAKSTMMLLGKKGMDAGSPIFIRIFKQESELEVWKARADGRFYHFKTYPICNWSGELGPKLQQGDKQAPEGFYRVRNSQMNPNSSFHLAFNLGYPNAYDRSHGRTGQFLMVHGKCRSAGCYAMTDALIEEIYALARESFKGGQDAFHVHAFPFRMTEENLRKHRKSRWYGFWRRLKEGYDHFELTRQPPEVGVCNRQYLVSVKFLDTRSVRADAPCPQFVRMPAVPFKPDVRTETAGRTVAPGVKRRMLADSGAPLSPSVSPTMSLGGLLGGMSPKRSKPPTALGFGD